MNKSIIKKLAKRFQDHSKQIFYATVLMVLSMTLVAGMSANVNIYEVRLGQKVDTVYSFSEDREKILENLDYDVEDYKVTEEASPNNQVKSLVLEEKFDVNIESDRRNITLYTAQASVSDILSEAGIALEPQDEVYPPKDEIMAQSGDIKVVRVKSEIVNEVTDISFDTVKRANNSMNAGQTRTAREGELGQKTAKFELIYKDGVVISKSMLSEEIIKQPVAEVLEYGTGGAVVTRSGSTLRYKKVIDVKATAYSTEGWSNTKTASGTTARVGAIAVDPNVIPLGSRLYVTSPDGKSWVYGHAVAEDTGGAIKGNKIDLFFDTQSECFKFGIRKAKVYVLS